MARVPVIEEALQICGRAGITPFLWGHRGAGKSSIIAQLAAGMGMGCVDLRCSQLEASDIRGLPKAGDDGRTHYYPPSEMPHGDMSDTQVTHELAGILDIEIKKKSNDDLADEIQERLANADLLLRNKYDQALKRLQTRFQRGILFLDEINRAQDDVQQAVFELVLDRSVGQYVLPPGWWIACAGNFMEGYMVTGFTDPAFIDRFCHLTLSIGEVTLEDWIHWMAGAHEEDAADVIEFASQNTDHLDGKIEGELGFNVQPSRRSWEMIVKASKVCKGGEFSEAARTEVYAGLVGRDLGTSFASYSCPVKPRELLARGVRAFETELKSLERPQLTGVMWGLVSFAKNKIEDDAIADVCIDFATFMAKHCTDKDVVVAFCRALVASGNKEDHQQKARAAVISNPRLASMISKFNSKTDTKKGFVDRLAEKPELQEALSKLSWGTADDDDED
jgi:MoxR-like ATPase